MPVPTLQSFAVGDANYIAKHNANYSAIASFLATLETALNSLTGGAATGSNSTNIGKATYGAAGGPTFIGTGSFAYTITGTKVVLEPGFCWDPALGLMHYQPNQTEVEFALAAPATYYIRLDGNSSPYRDTINTGAIYSVVWDGTAINSVTQLAGVTPSAPDIADLRYSAYSGITHLTPEDRFEATEKAFSFFMAANMAVGNFTPPEADVMASIGIQITGALTTSTTLTVPAKRKLHVIRNDCTTANGSTVTVKTPAGTGVALVAGENAILYCDGTNVFHIFRQGTATPVSSLLHLTDTPSTYVGQGLKLIRVRADEQGTEFVDGAAAVTPPALEVADEGVAVDSNVSQMSFTGPGVVVTQVAPGVVQVAVSASSGPALAVEDQGIEVDPGVVLINFEGDGVVVSQTAPGSITVTIPGPPPSGAVDYDVSFYVADKRPAGAVAFRHTFTKAVTFPANFSTSQADALTAATASSVWLIKKNGVQVGTLTFAASGTSGTFASTGGLAVSFVSGDILEVTAPDPQDATLVGVSVTLSGTRD